jgi:hypothetical protein
MCVCFLTLAVLCIACIEGIYTFISTELRPVLLCETPSPHVRAGRSENRMPFRAKFSAHAQPGPESHPASYTVCTGPRRYSPTPI